MIDLTLLNRTYDFTQRVKAACRYVAPRVRSSQQSVGTGIGGRLAAFTSCIDRCSRSHWTAMPVAVMAKTAARATIEPMYIDALIMSQTLKLWDHSSRIAR